MIRLSILVLILFATSCAGPSISKDKISKNWDPKLQEAIQGLYGDTVEAILSLRKIRQMGVKANKAIPFVASMLGDKRRAVGKYKQKFKVRFPVGTEAANTLGKMGQKSLDAIMGYLKENYSNRYYRGNASWALKVMKGKETFYPKFNGTEHAKTLIHALEEAMDCSESTPADLYYVTMSTRGGIFTLIEAVGMVGDKRAIPALKKIISNDKYTSIEKDNAKRALKKIKL